jgi:hypothetical protein
MSADEIEVVADRLMDGARETEQLRRALSRRIRENGVFASERLANFVRAANSCADVARSMQALLEMRDEAPDERAAGAAQAINQKPAAEHVTGASAPVDMNALGAKLEILEEESPPTQLAGGPDDSRLRPRPTDDKRRLAERPSARRPALSMASRKEAD